MVTRLKGPGYSSPPAPPACPFPPHVLIRSPGPRRRRVPSPLHHKERTGRAVARALIVAAALVCGCARAVPPPPVPMAVDVPVPEPVPCAVAIPPRPALPIAALGSDSQPADTIRSYAATVAVLKAAVVEREGLLHACIDSDSPAVAPAPAAAADRPAQGANR